MEASATDFEDKELAAALERSKTDSAAATKDGQPAAGSSAQNAAQPAAALIAAQPAAVPQPTPDAKLTALPSDKFTEENVLALIKYGFPREKVRGYHS